MKKLEIAFEEDKNYEQYQDILKLLDYWNQPKEKPDVTVEYNGKQYRLESVTIATVD